MLVLQQRLVESSAHLDQVELPTSVPEAVNCDVFGFAYEDMTGV
jgi:hypothetical protein